MGRTRKFIPIWDRTEVFFTMDMGEFAKAERILSSHKIPYRSKIVRHTTRNNQMLGRIGENENCNATYAVYTCLLYTSGCLWQSFSLAASCPQSIPGAH